MIVHIVMIKLKEDRKADAAKVKKILDSLPAKIEEIKAYEVGINEIESARAYDISLYSQFESYDTLKAYNGHPDHQEALKFIGEVADKVAAVDYTLS